MLKKMCVAFLFTGIFSFSALDAHAQMLGEIKMFAGNFAPKGWALCDGQLLSINQNQSLYTVLGTTYGGNGETNFALPDLRGRVAMHEGRGPGLSLRPLGEKGGTETNTLYVAQMPAHLHTVPVLQVDFNNKSLTFTNGIKSLLSTGSAPNATIPSAPAGSNQPVNNMQPYLAVNYIIAIVGTYPSRE